MEVTGKKTLVFGSGISGVGAARLLESHGANVILYDKNESLDRRKMQIQLGADSRAEIVLGEFPMEVLEELQLVILSPGVPTDLPVVKRMKEAGIAIIGEIELAYAFSKGDVLAITGTNGKTTTTSLLGRIMRRYRDNVFIVGNIGNPYTVAASRMTDETITVAELSSFQLETIDTFRPKVSIVLNFTQDHLNRHHTMEAYVRAKENIAKNQTEEDYCILNYEDELTREFGKNVRAQVLYFSSQRKLEKGIYLQDGDIIYKNDREIKVCNVKELQILGTHNYENVMAAAAAAMVYGVPINVVSSSIREFKGVEHRIEYVANKNGVLFYNDSKGTNPDAAIKGIQAMTRPTVLIGGGYDKDSSYKEWIQSFEGKVKKLILIGATKEKIAEDADACGFRDYLFADDFEDAVLKAAKLATTGEAVLLSPACASWDMFSSYEVRGDKFKEIVNSL